MEDLEGFLLLFIQKVRGMYLKKYRTLYQKNMEDPYRMTCYYFFKNFSNFSIYIGYD